MTSVDIENLFEERLRAAGFGDAFDAEKCQFLMLPDGFFAEVVLRKADNIEQAEQTVRRITEELTRDGIHVQTVVRAIWHTTTVSYVGPARSADGSLRTAFGFSVGLASGDRNINVTVLVTVAALQVLREKLGRGDQIIMGWAPQKGDVDEETLKALVRQFVGEQLRRGGMSYWDPRGHPELTLNEAAMSFLLGHSAAFPELWVAVDDAMQPPVLDSFARSLRLLGRKLTRFESDVVPELSSMLGGAFARGQTFSTSATELYSGLVRAEQELLKVHYERKLAEVRPQLEARYPDLF